MKRYVFAVAILIELNVSASVAIAGRQSPFKPPSNLQVLPKGTTLAQIIPMMKAFTQALGVRCQFCHSYTGSDPNALENFDFPADTVPAKETARNMYRMVEFLNANNLDKLQAVTCWTCHSGHERPSRLPPDRLAAVEAQWPAAAVATDNQKLTMAVYAASLGVTCEHCHTATDWKSDAKAAHRMVSRMTGMFAVFPKYMPAARTQCWMCHQGAVKPARLPS